MPYPTLFVHPKNDYTGSTRVLSNIIASDYNNDDVYVITQKGNGFLSNLHNVKLINYSEFHILSRPIPIITDFITRLKVFVLVLFYGRRFETVYINTIVPYSAALAARVIRKKVIYHIHEKFVGRSISFRIIEWVFNNTAAHRIYVSQYTKSKYTSNSKCTDEVLYNKLSNAYLKKVRFRPFSERKKMNILMISSLSLAKGVDVFVDLAKYLPQYNFTLILSAPQSKINNFFKDFNVPSNCEILPSQNDIHSFLYDADLMLNLSNPFFWVETFGMTILEAMPYGIPSIVPNVGGPLELVTDDYNGYCVDVTDIRQISNAIVKSLDDGNYFRLCNNTLDKFKQCFL